MEVYGCKILTLFTKLFMILFKGTMGYIKDVYYMP